MATAKVVVDKERDDGEQTISRLLKMMMRTPREMSESRTTRMTKKTTEDGARKSSMVHEAGLSLGYGMAKM